MILPILLALLVPPRAAPVHATITVDMGKPMRTFVPERAFGAALDGHEQGGTARIYTPANIAAMRSAGLRSITYRLRTELAIEAWHWNPRGTWSDPAHRRGYWTSDTSPGAPIRLSYGYRLPRRGNTVDQANDDGYSRLTDGDPGTFWKSNPYLEPHFTGEDSAGHPQWVVLDLGRRQRIGAIRILWGEPYARRFVVQRWAGDDDIYTDDPDNGAWRAFPGGAVDHGAGGDAVLRLAPSPVQARFVRILLLEGSGAAPRGSTDVRDGLGFAIREVYAGTADAAGRLRDVLRHTPGHGQTATYVSSTDPWHRVEDRDPGVEQPGIDLVYGSGLTSGLPALLPAGVLYDTPENAAALVRYVRARGCPVERIEMGEEPDEQYVDPEGYAALYLRFADALHAVDPGLVLGGPCFETIGVDVRKWPRPSGQRPWMTRFTDYLRAHGRLADFGFFSFEWYPFDQVEKPASANLVASPRLMSDCLARLVREGLPRSIPWLMTEYGYSAFGGRPEVDVDGALFTAETMARFLELGGDAAYFYGCEPGELIEEKPGCWGNNLLFLADQQGRVKARLATFHAARFVTQQWALPGSGTHELYHAGADALDARGRALVTAYCLRRPDGRRSLLIVNKDPRHTIEAAVRVRSDGAAAARSWQGPADIHQFGRAQYEWHEAGKEGRPIRSLPPVHFAVGAGPIALRLPPYSLTVLRDR